MPSLLNSFEMMLLHRLVKHRKNHLQKFSLKNRRKSQSLKIWAKSLMVALQKNGSSTNCRRKLNQACRVGTLKMEGQCVQLPVGRPDTDFKTRAESPCRN